MKRASMLVALLLGLPRTAAAGEPVCAREEVLSYAARELSRETAYERLIAESVGERPTRDPRVVLCAADVIRADYDYPAYRRETWIEYRSWTVRVLEHGYEVDTHP